MYDGNSAARSFAADKLLAEMLTPSAALLYFSRSAFIHLGGAREHRDTVSELPICLNKEKMDWGVLQGECERGEEFAGAVRPVGDEGRGVPV